MGALLGALAAAAPQRARVCELGTGAGVGLAWIVHGLGDREDATVYTVDTDQQLLATVAAAGWPGYVQFVCDDGVHAVAEFAPFDLVFADAPAGKVDGLDATLAALAPGGVLVVDDMDPALHADDGYLEPLAAVRERLVHDPGLVAAELDFASGVVVATKRA
ncbi:MAG TPA: class I SAM-dependent methyltransferase [Acidimicrobiia bacterium]|nr:class I SAM-dependent methyltransferase [Acidimicrobiia bacterium]